MVPAAVAGIVVVTVRVAWRVAGAEADAELGIGTGTVEAVLVTRLAAVTGSIAVACSRPAAGPFGDRSFAVPGLVLPRVLAAGYCRSLGHFVDSTLSAAVAP